MAEFDALQLVKNRLKDLHGYLGARLIRGTTGKRAIAVSWLEFAPIPALPAVVRGVPVLVMPRSAAAPKGASVGAWYDTWKRAGSDAWSEYTATLRDYWS